MHLLGPESLTEFHVHSFEIMHQIMTKTHHCLLSLNRTEGFQLRPSRAKLAHIGAIYCFEVSPITKAMAEP